MVYRVYTCTFRILNLVSIFFIINANLLITNKTNGQGLNNRIFEWKSYQSHTNGKALATNGLQTIMLNESGLVEHDFNTNQYRYFTKIDGLYGSNPTAIAYDPETNLFFIGYGDGVIESFERPHLPKRLFLEIKLSRNVQNKQINGLFIYQKRLYVGFEAGLVVYSLERFEVSASVLKIGGNTPQSPVYSVAVHAEQIYVATGRNGIFSAFLSSNVLDANVWKPVFSEPCYFVLAKFNQCYAISQSVLYQLKNQVFAPVLNPNPTNATIIKAVRAFDFNQTEMLIAQGSFIGRMSADTLGFTRYAPVPKGIVLLPGNGNYAIADSTRGLWVYRDNQLLNTSDYELPNNKCQRIAVGNHQLYVAPLGTSGLGLPAYDYSGIYYRDLSTNRWTILTTANNAIDLNRTPHSFGVATFDSKNNRAFMGAVGSGFVALKQGKIEQVFDNQNSCMNGTTRNSAGRWTDIRVSSFAIDPLKGGLWVATQASARPLTYFTAQDSNCTSFSAAPGGEVIVSICADNFGQVWCATRANGIKVLDTKNTPADISDDETRSFNEGVSFGNLPTNRINCVVLDKQNFIWAGTNAGVAVFYDLIGKSDAVCPIYNQQCLLNNEDVTTIAIDGANRKWFGTRRSGVFLFNQDGTEQLAHFNTDNSPLPSNNISDIGIEPETGEVFFATAGGLVSYRGSATEPKLNVTEIEVFPNPVTPGFAGMIALRGSGPNAKVRICTPGGVTVRELTADGGQTLWDGNDTTGRRVEPGVYIVLVANDEGKQTGVGKVAILGRE